MVKKLSKVSIDELKAEFDKLPPTQDEQKEPATKVQKPVPKPSANIEEVPVADVVLEVPDEDEAEDKEQQKDVVFIYHEKCLNCLHLTETGEQSYKKCHFSNGNDECPAQSIRIVVGVPVEKAARAIFNANIAGDYIRLSDLYAKLGVRDESVSRAVMARVKQMQSQ